MSEAQAVMAESKSETSLLAKVLVSMKHTEEEHAKTLLVTFVEEAKNGKIEFNKNLTTTMGNTISKIDQAISTQLAEIFHTKAMQDLEGSWRGIQYLVSNSELDTSLKIKLLNVKKGELKKDLERAVEFDQSTLFKKIYEKEYGSPGGEPYSALVGDFEFSNHPTDVDMLTSISGVAAAAFCPFISAAGPRMFGFDSWLELSQPRDLAKIFDTAEYVKWNSLRNSEDSRFVTLVMPRVMSRLPYGKDTDPIEDFDFEETKLKNGKTSELPHEHYCWMNASYALALRLTTAFSLYGWCTAIRGAEGGGKVECLATHTFISDSGEIHTTCPTEIGITDRREAELSSLGFLPLSHYKNTNYAVFFGGQSIQKPKQYDIPNATANAEISARMPYIMATSRFSHYLKVMARDKIGAFVEISNVENWLNRWILNYVNSNADSGPEMKAKYPLAEAKVEVKEVTAKPGSYYAIIWMRPWLQMEELTTSMRMVAKIPKFT